jgi:hypothetical protein
MNLFVGKIGKAGAMTSSENPERAGEIHLDVRFDEAGGKGAHESSYRFCAEQGHWRFLFDGFVDHRVSSRIEVTPLDINTLELLKKVVYGPCDVTPVQDAKSQFDLVATCLSEDEAIAWANYFAGNAEDLLRQRGFLGAARIIEPAKRKTEPTPEARIEELEKHFNPELPQFKTQYRATCRIEVRLKKGNTEALLNKAMGKFCTVVPVPGVEDQFDLVVTDPDPAQTSRLANSLGKDAEELLKEREVHGTVKIIRPAERPEKPWMVEGATAAKPTSPEQAINTILKAAEERNARVFQNGFSKSFKAKAEERGESLDQFGDFARTTFLSSKTLDATNAEVVVESNESSRRRFTFWMILEDGEWKLNELGSKP